MSRAECAATTLLQQTILAKGMERVDCVISCSVSTALVPDFFVLACFGFEKQTNVVNFSNCILNNFDRSDS